jgi:hypothetical protein
LSVAEFGDERPTGAMSDAPSWSARRQQAASALRTGNSSHLREASSAVVIDQTFPPCDAEARELALGVGWSVVLVRGALERRKSELAIAAVGDAAKPAGHSGPRRIELIADPVERGQHRGGVTREMRQCRSSQRGEHGRARRSRRFQLRHAHEELQHPMSIAQPPSQPSSV